METRLNQNDSHSYVAKYVACQSLTKEVSYKEQEIGMFIIEVSQLTLFSWGEGGGGREGGGQLCHLLVFVLCSRLLKL